MKILAIDAVNHSLIAVPKPFVSPFPSIINLQLLISGNTRYTQQDAEFWVRCMVQSKDELLCLPSIEGRKKRLFEKPLGVDVVPLQVIRYFPDPEGQGILVGCCSLSPRDGTGDSVELGYYLAREHWGKGIMSVAAETVLRWGKEQFGIENLFSSADCMNPGSAKVIERVSARTVREGETVKKSEKYLTWPVEKVVPGREVKSLSKTWEWRI